MPAGPFERELAKPIIVLGAPKSGTSMLFWLLARHPDLHGAVEPRFQWRYGNDRRSDMLRPEDARPEIVAYIRSKFGRMVADAGKKRLLVKQPANSLRPGFVDRVFPDAKFLHIQRDGVDAVLSMVQHAGRSAAGLRPGAGKPREAQRGSRLSQRRRELEVWRMPYYFGQLVRRAAPRRLRPILGPTLWGPQLPGMGSLAKELTPLELACLQWRMSEEISTRFGRTLPADRYAYLRLEQVTEDNFAEAVRMCELSPAEEVLEWWRETYTPGRVSKRRQRASEEELATIRSWIEPTQRWLGQI